MTSWMPKLLKFNKAESQDMTNAMDMLVEEVRETDQALAVWDFATSLTGELDPKRKTSSASEVLDGFADTIFVSVSSMMKFLRQLGVSEDRLVLVVTEIMMIVCNANASKVGADGEFIRNAKGKIMKPEGFVSPNAEISKLLLDELNIVQ